jgi:hypothetical protein
MPGERNTFCQPSVNYRNTLSIGFRSRSIPSGRRFRNTLPSKRAVAGSHPEGWLLGFAFGGRSWPGAPRLRSRRLPRGFPPFRRLPPRSDLATSYWKAQCQLVLAVHDDEGSRGTGCAQTWCPGRWETAPLLPGVQVECLRSPMIGPASSLFQSPVQLLPVVVPPSSAKLVVCRWDQQRTADQLRPFPAQTLHGEDETKGG